MIQAKADFFDRFGQTWKLLKQNFLKLIAAILIFKAVSYIVFSVIFVKYFTSFLDFSTIMENPEGALMDLYTNTELMIAFVVYVTLSLVFALLVLPFLIATWKSVVDCYYQREIDIKKNIIYGWKNFGNVIHLYWLWFAYVALIPALLFIGGGVMANLALFGIINKEIFLNIGYFIMGISALLALISLLYRGLKTVFIFLGSIDTNNFTKETFQTSIKITDNSWWRIVGNIILLSLLVSLITSFITGIVGLPKSIVFAMSLDIDAIMQAVMKDPSSLDIAGILKQITPSTAVVILGYIKDIVVLLISSASIAFSSLFMFLFMKSLESDNTTAITEVNNKTIITEL